MAYAGALEPIDRNDEGIHGYIQGILSDKETKIEFVPFAERSYITLNAEVTPDMTMRQLAESVKGLLGQCGRQNMFQIVIEGFRNVDFELDEGMLMRLGRVLSVRDHSVPDFDFQHLYEENQNDHQCFNNHPRDAPKHRMRLRKHLEKLWPPRQHRRK